jgi:hypothetical protein
VISRLTDHIAGSGNSIDFAVVEEAQDVGIAELRLLAVAGWCVPMAVPDG